MSMSVEVYECHFGFNGLVLVLVLIPCDIFYSQFISPIFPRNNIEKNIILNMMVNLPSCSSV